MEILLGIIIAIIVGALVAAFAVAIWRWTRDVRQPNFELLQVQPDFVCFGDTCPIRIRYRVTNVGADQQVHIGMNYRPVRVGAGTQRIDLGVEPTGDIAILPNLVNFADGPGLVEFDIKVRATTGTTHFPEPIPLFPPTVSLMSENEPTASISFQAEAGDQAVGRITGPTRFFADTETDLAARAPQSVSRFCKNSQLIALSVGSSNIISTDFNIIPQATPLSADVTVNQQNLYNLSPGQEVNLQSPIPIGDGIMLETTVPTPAGVTEWPAGSIITCSILLHIACPS